MLIIVFINASDKYAVRSFRENSIFSFGFRNYNIFCGKMENIFSTGFTFYFLVNEKHINSSGTGFIFIYKECVDNNGLKQDSNNVP